MDELTALKNIVRTGWVSSVNAADRSARVTFQDKGETFVSGPLKVLKNPPFIPACGVPQQTEAKGGESDGTSFESHVHAVKISPWLPAPGNFVLCIYLPNGDGDGFVIGEV